MVSLDELKKEIDQIGEDIRSLKTSSDADPNAVKEKVNQLLAKKKEYAENNNGIGVDGKPYEAPLSKAEKKKRDKELKKKQQQQQQEGGDKKEDGGGEGDGEMSANAKKKAAKKAEAKAKKAAMKNQNAAGGGGGGGKDGVKEAEGKGKKAPEVKKAAGKPVTATASAASQQQASLQAGELAMNPNAPVHERAVVALTVAVMCNLSTDLNLVSDHKRLNPSLGTPGGAVVVGDMAITRYLLRNLTSGTSVGSWSTAPLASSLLGSESPQTEAMVDQWVDYALATTQHASHNNVDQAKLQAILVTLNNHLTLNQCTYLVGNKLTLADIALYAALGWPSILPPHRSNLAQTALDTAKANNAQAAILWMNTLAHNPSLQTATQLAMGIANNIEVSFHTDDTLDLAPLHGGMDPLRGATPGNVVTRFPPEPSGYLHIGHVKAVLLNHYYAKRYKGRLIVRFDDTNPTKEKAEFEESIIQDLATLGVQGDVLSYTSDYFDLLYGYALQLIRCGLAYMDDTPQEQMQKERMERQPSKYRDSQTMEETLQLFELMRTGSEEEGGKWCLRAKIDMNSVNGTMRDPVIYRQNLTPHHRSGTSYRAYPTYDLACPIVDSLEGVTHALRTTEYNDRDEQYAWFQRALGIRRVRIHSFARMNFMYTELSKRKLTWFVDNGYVTGWDDPRFPTVRGVKRRGLHVEALRNFILSQGASRRVTNMEWSKFWAENKKEIDKTAKRYMAIDASNHVALRVTNAPEAEECAFVSTDFHPKDPALGKRVVRIAKEVILEKVDTDGLVVGENVVLMRWGVVTITKVPAEGSDEVLEATYVPDGDVKAAKRKLSWLAKVPECPRVTLTEFDNLISKEKLEEEDNFKDFINPNTMASSEVLGDAGLKTLQRHDVIQLERRGYFRVDRPYLSEAKSLVLFMIPDGKAKPMSGLVGKLAHR